MTENVPPIVFNGPPNGNVIASVGAVCLDASPDGAVWVKVKGADAYGWEKAKPINKPRQQGRDR